MYSYENFIGIGANGKKVIIIGKFKKIDVTTTTTSASSSDIISPIGEFYMEDGRRVQRYKDDFYKISGCDELISCPAIAQFINK